MQENSLRERILEPELLVLLILSKFLEGFNSTGRDMQFYATV